jgi:high-affinity K+ transport system ATPase subunit B
MQLTSSLALLAEEAGKNATPNPLALGVVAGGILLVLLIVVTRFNKDR